VSIDKSKVDALVGRFAPIAPPDHARQVVDEHVEKEKAIKIGISYFNDERFWEAHEVFEGVWKKCFEGEKELVQGIILVAAALVHFQKDEKTICLSVLGRALQKLGHTSGTYHDIDVDALRRKILEIKNSGEISPFTI
jgi:predicted metal-dependent hydrolase